MRSWHGNIQERHPLAVPLLLIAVILAVYYPAMLSGVHMVDDPGIVALYAASPALSQILLPGEGYYYRPLLELSFWLDNLLWGMEPSAMHLENILLHCADTLLVYLLARKVQKPSREGFHLLPLLAALLFALHPVNVEAVAWIAGRTDPMLALMMLSSCYFWFSWLEDPRGGHLLAALLFFGAALLTKETALAAGGVLVLTALCWQGRASARQRLTAVGLIATPALLLVLSALFFRSGTSALSRFISGSELHLWQGVREICTAFGFYAAKLVFPLQLNFAITGVHPGYAFAGVALVPALCWLWLRQRTVAILFTCALVMIVPAVVVAVKPIAWTPFAERYLYLPSALCAVGLSAWVGPGSRQFRLTFILAAVPVLVLFAFFTVQRTMLWKDKLAFIEDAIAKSPGFGSLYNDLGVIYLQREDIDKAADAFAVADRLNQRESMRLLIKSNLLSVEVARGNYLGVRASFFKLFGRKKDAPAQFLELLHKADTRRLATLSGSAKVELARDLLETLDLLNQKRYDPFWLYRSGQLSLIEGDRTAAADFFRRAHRFAPADAHYREAARVYLKKLGQSP